MAELATDAAASPSLSALLDGTNAALGGHPNIVEVRFTVALVTLAGFLYTYLWGGP